MAGTLLSLPGFCSFPANSVNTRTRLLHANRKVFLNSGLREAPIIRRPFAFPVCGDLFEFLGELPPAAHLNPRIRTRHLRRPEGASTSISARFNDGRFRVTTEAQFRAHARFVFTGHWPL